MPALTSPAEMAPEEEPADLGVEKAPAEKKPPSRYSSCSTRPCYIQRLAGMDVSW